MIARCHQGDLEEILLVINEAAKRYEGVIPRDLYHSPYMGKTELLGEIGSNVIFYGYYLDGRLLGVMGIQDVKDVTLIRHAYVMPQAQGRGIGGSLLRHLLAQTDRRVLVGTWADADWAIRFYERHRFKMTTPQQTERLLKKYWKIPKRQVETSVVLDSVSKPRVITNTLLH
jgi:GNAT superfamily N-acetyltransferase